MSHDPNEPEIDDARLDRHIDALRRTDVPPGGPSANALAATLAMLAVDPSQAEATTRRSDAAARFARGPLIRKERFHMSFPQKFVAAAVLAIAAGGSLLMFGPLNGGATIAYGQIVERLAAAHSMAYMTSVDVPGGGPGVSIRTVVADGGRMRSEMPGGAVTIRNGNDFVSIDPKARTVTRVDLANAPAATRQAAPTSMNLLEGLKQIVGNTAEPAGERVIDGVACTGFHAPWPSIGTVTVWADKKTAAPRRVEMEMRMTGKPMTAVIDRFEIDPPVDDAMFSVAVPAGYTLTTQRLDVANMGAGRAAEAVVPVLRAYAAASDGAFPASLTDWAPMFATGKNDKPKVDAQLVGALGGQLFSMHAGYGYDGEHVRLGEADKIVFWTKSADGKTARAVFGDLRIEEVDVSRVPATRATTVSVK